MKNAKAKLRVIEKNSKRLSDEEQHELQRQHEVNLIMGDLEKETGKADLWLKSLEGVMQGKAPTMVGPAIDINALKAELVGIEGDLHAAGVYYEHLGKEREVDLDEEEKYQDHLGIIEKNIEDKLWDLQANKTLMNDNWKEADEVMRQALHEKRILSELS